MDDRVDPRPHGQPQAVRGLGVYPDMSLGERGVN
jgi:hypothetical protein